MLYRALRVSLLSLYSLPARWGVALVVVICIAGASGVLVSMLAMADGFQQTFRKAGRADRIIVLSTGELSEPGSSISRDQLPVLLDAPGLARLANGKPAASVERFTISPLPQRERGKEGNLVVRGVGMDVLAVRPEVHLTAGRMFQAGLRELIVGRAAQAHFPALGMGAQVSLSGVDWTVVGVFESGGSALESEAWGEVEAVMSAYNQSSYSSLTAMLESTASFQAYKDAVTSDPALSHTPQHESDYFAAQGGTLSAAMQIIGYVVSAIMGLGALFAAVNTMYASIESRSVEIATLRAIGFEATPIVLSVLLECILLCGAGAALGGGVAYLLFNGYTVSTLSTASFSQVSFAFNVTPALLGQGALSASVIGLLGGLFPALHAVRVPVIDGLRAA
ncbi:MAG TPA: ABC transporter permease [Fontimonas sp.]